MDARIRECVAKREKYNKLFMDTFGVPLSRFYDNLFGLDIIEFDTWLKTPDGTSTSDWITTNYGEAAFEMVRDLL